MSIQHSIQSIQDTIDQIISVSKGLPEPVIRWKPSDEKWSVIEVLCHVEEATPYWLNEIESLLKAPGSEWGRGLQHEGRLAAVAGAESRTIPEALEGIERTKAAVAEVLGRLSETDLSSEAPSRNPRFGTKPLSFIVQHLLVDHVDTHLKQLQRNILQYNEANPTK